MLEARQARYAANLPAVQDGRTRATREKLQAERDALAAALDGADAVALANADERALLERLARVNTTLAAMPAEEAAPLRERARRVAGALQWQLERAVPERRWAARKALREIETQLAQAGEREAALQAVQRDEPTRFAAFGQRIAALRTRIAGLLPQVAALQAEQQRELQAVAVRHLQAQQGRLAEYTTQARFALARLQDPATLAAKKEDGDVAPR